MGWEAKRELKKINKKGAVEEDGSKQEEEPHKRGEQNVVVLVLHWSLCWLTSVMVFILTKA